MFRKPGTYGERELGHKVCKRCLVWLPGSYPARLRSVPGNFGGNFTRAVEHLVLQGCKAPDPISGYTCLLGLLEGMAFLLRKLGLL